jgi:hypothetical protein
LYPFGEALKSIFTSEEKEFWSWDRGPGNKKQNPWTCVEKNLIAPFPSLHIIIPPMPSSTYDGTSPHNIPGLASKTYNGLTHLMRLKHLQEIKYLLD